MEKFDVWVLCFYILFLVLLVFIIGIINPDETIRLDPVKDEYNNKIIYYVDTRTKKTYKIENDVLYYYEEVIND